MKRAWDYPFTPVQHVRTAPKPEETAPKPLCNIRMIGDLTPGETEWWLSFGRHLDAARASMGTVPTGLNDPARWRECFPGRW